MTNERIKRLNFGLACKALRGGIMHDAIIGDDTCSTRHGTIDSVCGRFSFTFTWQEIARVMAGNKTFELR